VTPAFGQGLKEGISPLAGLHGRRLMGWALRSPPPAVPYLGLLARPAFFPLPQIAFFLIVRLLALTHAPGTALRDHLSVFFFLVFEAFALQACVQAPPNFSFFAIRLPISLCDLRPRSTPAALPLLPPFPQRLAPQFVSHSLLRHTALPFLLSLAGSHYPFLVMLP